MTTRSWLSAILVTTFQIVVLGCSESTVTPPAPPVPTSITLSTNTASFTHLGQTIQINATVNDQNGAAMSTAVGWSVVDAAVATVTGAGAITAMRDGATTVRATAGNVTASVSVSVAQQASTLILSTSAVSLSGLGATHVVSATVRDAGGSTMTGAPVAWTSANSAVAAVSGTGVITSAGLGTTEITAVAGTASAKVAVSVVAATIPIITPRGMETMIRGVNVRFPLTAQAAGVRWSSSNPAIATIDSVTGQVHTVAEGAVTFTATSPGGAGSWTRSVVRKRRMQVDPYLATPIAGALWEVPVVLIEYHPTADAANLDVLRAPGYGQADPMTLDSLERLTMRIAKRRKMMVEQGSRFRGYADVAAQPSLGYRVVEHIIVYDQIPPHPTKRHQSIPGNPRFEDWHSAFADLQLVPLLRTHKAREVWAAWSSFDGNFPVYKPNIHKVEDMRVGWESNMSSPATGDVSNSDRDPNDAPVIEHTYIIYGINFRRSQAEAVHNVGHQVEAMFAHVNARQDGNTLLFWRDFVGQDANRHFIKGRAGWTHMPPNTTTDYDYLNPALVASDIEDWRPDNSGAKKQVSVGTWANLTYPWPGEADFHQRTESQWYVYWFQNFPGRANRVPHGTNWMTNWWAFIADWDAAVGSNLGLYGPAPAAQRGLGVPYTFAPASVVDAPIRHGPRR